MTTRDDDARPNQGEPGIPDHEETHSLALGEEPTPAKTTKSTPETIGGYTIFGVLGEGGMGMAYEVEQLTP